MKDFQKRTAFYIIAAILVAIGLYAAVISNPSSACKATDVVANKCQAITYHGIDGKNALDLLKQAHQVETQTSSFGEFVTAIDGVKPDNQHFWAFYVNDKLSDVGAGSYQTKNSDAIKWQLDQIQ